MLGDIAAQTINGIGGVYYDPATEQAINDGSDLP
jgi:hypothetical protein